MCPMRYIAQTEEAKSKRTIQACTIRLHGVLVSIILDRDPRFIARFWEGFWRAMGTQLMMSIAFHPQTDGQSEDHSDIRGHATSMRPRSQG